MRTYNKVGNEYSLSTDIVRVDSYRPMLQVSLHFTWALLGIGQTFHALFPCMGTKISEISNLLR